MTMSKNQFRGLLTRIRNTGEKLDEMIATAIAYCTTQHVQHGNKEPWSRLWESVPAFARGVVAQARKAANEQHKAAQGQPDDVREEAGAKAAAQAEKAAGEVLTERRKGQRKAAEKRKAAKAEPQAVEPRGTGTDGKGAALVYIGADGKAQRTSLTDEEYRVAIEAVEAHRKAQRKAKAA